ncbi:MULTISPECIES: hypothetical protein [Desulfovibrionaceae]|jgi:hypothetical protein|uniref:hypothetical protein n=1 Tax=Desulfovibrionaceae TaxID=194924 RepID=UPI002432F774|nr:hypothetical protein [Bilophila wadsworthia]MDR4026400.1 hypothetical protein [Bilophila sp.]
MMTAEEKEFVDAMLDKLPPVIARHQVDRFLGGLVSPFTVKNADLAGTGPEVAWRVGNKVAYKTDSLVGWLVQTMGVKRIQNLNSL